MIARTARSARFGRLPALAVLLLALACQVASGVLLPRAAASASPSEALAAVTVFCAPGHHPAEHRSAPHHRATDRALLLAAVAGASAHVTGAAASPGLPAPMGWLIGAATRPPVRAPPRRNLAAAYPRGPPAFAV